MSTKQLDQTSAKSSASIERPPDPQLVRMVVRVDKRLPRELADIAEHLFKETRLEYSRASIFRGLIALGLASVKLGLLEAPPLLERLFHGARVRRGRKRGTRWASVEGIDVTAKGENEHQEP